MAEAEKLGPNVPPDTGQSDKVSYAERLKTNIRYDQRLKRNVLDIEIEKLDKDNDLDLSQSCVARLLTSIGMNISSELKGYQIMYGRGVTLAVWCAPGVNLEKFCRTESIQVTRGVWTKNIRPSGRKDVVVTVSGLDFNTPDSLIREYIEKFGGKFVSSETIYGKHGDGPLKGVFNGDRKYNVEFIDPSKPMGTYHFIDGAKVRIFYRGNLKTCARCHSSAEFCPGGGIAKECLAQGGPKVDLAQHMKKVWQLIGFTPTAFKLPEKTDSNDVIDAKFEGDVVISDQSSFARQIERPELSQEDIQKVVGLQVRNFPTSLSDDKVLEFFKKYVDKSITLERISFMRNEHILNASVESGLDGPSVLEATKIIEFRQSRTKYFEKPLYCRILKNLTPEKIIQNLKDTETSTATAEEISSLKLKDNESGFRKNLFNESKGVSNMQSVKEKTNVFEDKKIKSKKDGQKIVEFGLVNASTQQNKRSHNDVGSPTSPEVKSTPKKSKAGEKTNIKI